jgi:hypothetical protein
MLALKVDTTDLDVKLKMLMEMPDLIVKSVVGAMTETVNEVHAAQLQEMKLSFNNPTPWLQKGLIKSLPYGKDRQSGGIRMGQTLAQSGTYFEEFPVGRSPNDIIRPHVKGGPRGLKANEKRMRNFTQGAGPYAVMGYSYPKNTYGNIPGSVYSRMLADLGTIPTAIPRSKEGRPKDAKFFVMKQDDGQEYIAERVGKNLRTVLVFTKKTPKYKVRYNYYEVGKAQVKYFLPRHFDRILKRYMDRL